MNEAFKNLHFIASMLFQLHVYVQKYTKRVYMIAMNNVRQDTERKILHTLDVSVYAVIMGSNVHIT